MVALALGALLSVACAYMFVRRVDPESPLDRVAAESLILAPALPAAVLFLLSILSVQWSRGLLFACGILAVLALGMSGKRQSVMFARRERPRSRHDVLLAILPFLLVVLLFGGYAQFAVVSAGAENDFIGIWGAKGRTFFESGRIDFEFLSAPWRGYAHPDYPVLLPLVFSAIAVASGDWSESMLGLVYPSLALGGLLLALSELRLGTPRLALQWLGVLALVPFVMSPWIGLADGPLALMVLASLLRFARWLDEPKRVHLTMGAVFLGLAMSTKNEGIALGVVATLVIVWMTPRQRRGTLIALWPAALIALPWLVLRSIHHLPTDLFEGGVLARLAERFLDFAYLSALGGYLVQYRPGQWLIYLAIGVALVLWRARLGAGARMICFVVSCQIAIDLAAYLATPLPIEWHVRWSWERLVSQVGAVFAVIGVSLLVQIVEERSGGSRFPALVGTGPEVQNEQTDPDADG